MSDAGLLPLMGMKPEDSDMPPESPQNIAPADGERNLIDAARREADGLRGIESGSVPLPPAKSAFPGYDILREVRRGGQGAVYEAFQRSTSRKVAIKVMLAGPWASDGARVRFEREIRLLANLRHPNIVAIHDGGVSDGHPYFVMDYISGEHLHRYCQSHSLDAKGMVRLFRQVVDAVACAHKHDIVHRDLKPANILVDQNGTPYVLDFGLAKMVSRYQGDPATAVSRTGEMLGTPRYMSPEQVSGDSDSVDARTDVHALGVILHELLVGSHPYGGGTSLSAMIDTIRNTEPPRISTLRPETDAALEKILLKAMCKEPERRYPSALEMRQDLDVWLGCYGNGSVLVGHDRHRWLQTGVLSAACLVLLAVSLAVVSSWNHPQMAGTDRRDRQSVSAESGNGLSQARVFPVTTTRSAVDAGTKQNAALKYVQQNLPLRGLRVQAVPGGEGVRVEGSLLNEAERQILKNRLAYVQDQVQLEVQVEPEAVRLSVQKALVEAGGEGVRVRLEGRNGDQSLNVEFLRTDSAPVLEALARDFVFDRAAVRFRVY